MRRMRTWGVGAAAAIVVVAGGAVALAGGPRRAPALPPVAPASLIASVIQSGLSPSPVSGDVAVHVDLGLPDLTDLEALGGGTLSFLAGDRQLRVWLSPDGYRVSDILPQSERSLVVGRRGAWTWDFDTLTATRLGRFPLPGGLFGLLAGLVDPTDLVARALLAVSGSTTVEVDGSTLVAGRPAYRLVVRPRTSNTLVGRIEIDVDADHRLPLALEVFPRAGTAAALSIRFTSVRFGAIDPSTFDFSPPPGSTVMRGTHAAGVAAGGLGLLTLGVGGVRVLGSGWTSVMAVPLPVPAANAGGLDLTSFLPLSGPLFSARLATEGGQRWLLVGAVPQDALRATAGELARS